MCCLVLCCVCVCVLYCVVGGCLAPEFRVVQKEISNLLKDRILIGHSVKNDLKVC